MSLWGWNGADFEKQGWHSLQRRGRAVLYGCAPSLKDADKVEEGAMRFVQNHAYKEVDPHIWIGMDKPAFFGEELLDLPCRKIFRVTHGKETVGGRNAYEWGDVYFADIVVAPRSHIWFGRGIDTGFLWMSNTMTVALHIILWMGFKEIVFSGIELGGEYFDDRKLSAADKDKIKKLFDLEFEFMTWFSCIAREQGIKLVNRSKTSRLAAIMETVEK